MTCDDKYLIRLLSASINQEAPLLPDYKQVNWEYIYEQSIKQNIIPLIYSSVRQLPIEYQPSFLKQWQMQTLKLSIKSIKIRQVLFGLFDEFKNAGINILLYKGLIISEYYPEPELRLFGDIDLLIQTKDIDVAVSLLERIGYEKRSEDKEKQFLYFCSPDGLIIDLQTKVWNYYEIKDITVSQLIETTAWLNPIVIPIDHYRIPTLGIQEHLFCIICHAAKHFISQGIGIRHLADITLYINKNYMLINWESLFDLLEKINLKIFFENLLSLSNEYFSITRLPLFNKIIPNKDTLNMLIEDLLDAGIFGRGTHERLNATPIVKEAFYYQKRITRLKAFLLTIFPTKTALIAKYSYAKKNSILLPIAWVHRAFRYIFKVDQPQKSLTVIERTRISTKRLQLLNKLGITLN